VRETLTLSSAAAPLTYRYRLSFGAGTHAELTHAGAVAIRGADGSLLYTLAAPTIADSSTAHTPPSTGPAHYELSEEGSLLTLRLDRAWLTDPRRVFPVTVDPDVYFSEVSDCTLRSGESASTSLCGGPLYIGSGSSGTARSVLRLNLSSIPPDRPSCALA
jgi:hypothetical protein